MVIAEFKDTEPFTSLFMHRFYFAYFLVVKNTYILSTNVYWSICATGERLPMIQTLRCNGLDSTIREATENGRGGSQDEDEL